MRYCRQSRLHLDYSSAEFCTGSGYNAAQFQDSWFHKEGGPYLLDRRKILADNAFSAPEEQSILRYRNRIQRWEKIFPTPFIFHSMAHMYIYPLSVSGLWRQPPAELFMSSCENTLRSRQTQSGTRLPLQARFR